MASAGRILIMPKGTYNASTTYEMLDLVYYNGTSWLAKKTAQGIEPSAANSEYWQNLTDFTPSTIGIKDYIVDQGKLNGWVYRKWNSGVAECWYDGVVDFTTESAATTAIAGLNILRKYIDFPFTFKTEPKAFANIKWRYTEWLQASPTVSTCGIRKFCTNDSAALKDDIVHIYAVGNWK